MSLPINNQGWVELRSMHIGVSTTPTVGNRNFMAVFVNKAGLIIANAPSFGPVGMSWRLVQTFGAGLPSVQLSDGSVS
jgi:hypothetical protein